MVTTHSWMARGELFACDARARSPDQHDRLSAAQFNVWTAAHPRATNRASGARSRTSGRVSRASSDKASATSGGTMHDMWRTVVSFILTVLAFRRSAPRFEAKEDKYSNGNPKGPPEQVHSEKVIAIVEVEHLFSLELADAETVRSACCTELAVAASDAVTAILKDCTAPAEKPLHQSRFRRAAVAPYEYALECSSAS